jgi:predicted metal-dependent enzyme (double-stranded beta helix superfamily)
MATFDLDGFLADCSQTRTESEPRRAVHDVLERALARPNDVADTLHPTEGGLELLFRSPELTILHVVWAPGMQIYPHDHGMWAVIGIYAGQEDNTFYRRSGPEQRSLVESGGKELATGDVAELGDRTIHAVANPTDRLTGAIHIYGGDFISEPRSQWGPGPVEERPYDMDEVRRQFAAANRAWLRTEA